ncbi:50S ribosomal protein L37e [Candidatus Woesearchaeota archaeon]|nr:50S ribosomal protein L37e [Candidatus Woesearchaeota archaeon]
MSKGTAARGRNSSKKSHIICRRCSGHSYHIHKKRCSSCGYGKTSKVRSYSWQKK